MNTNTIGNKKHIGKINSIGVKMNHSGHLLGNKIQPMQKYDILNRNADYIGVPNNPENKIENNTYEPKGLRIRRK